MLLKDWAFLGNYDFYTNKLKVLATNELPPEKWSYAGKNDFGILRNYLSLLHLRKIVAGERSGKRRRKATDHLYG